MKNSGIKCEIGITYDNVERLNTYLEKAVQGADQLHIVAGVHDKQATTFSGYVYNKENTPIITSVHYPIEFDTNKIALIDLRVNKMYTDEFGHNFIKCRSLTEESLRKIVFAMQREVFGIVGTEEPIKKVDKHKENKVKTSKSKEESVNTTYVEQCEIPLCACRNEEEHRFLMSLKPLKKMTKGKRYWYDIDDLDFDRIKRAIETKFAKAINVATRLGVQQPTLKGIILRKMQKNCEEVLLNVPVGFDTTTLEPLTFLKDEYAKGADVYKTLIKYNLFEQFKSDLTIFSKEQMLSKYCIGEIKLIRIVNEKCRDILTYESYNGDSVAHNINH